MHLDTRHPSEWIAAMTQEAVAEAPAHVDVEGALPPTHALISVIVETQTSEPLEIHVMGHAAVLGWLSEEYALVVSRYLHETAPLKGHVHRRHLWPLPGHPTPRHVSEIQGLRLPEAVLALVEPLVESAAHS